MFWFDLLFTPSMLLFPLAFALCFRRARNVAINAARVRRLTWLLASATVAALGLFALARSVWGPHVARYLWPLFFPLWFCLAMPLWVAKNPNLKPHDPLPTARTATLVSRAHANPVPGWWAGLMWGVWAVLLIVVLARMTRPLEGDDWSTWVTALGSVLVGLVAPLVTPFAVRRAVEEPEPLDAGASPQLAEAYARNRAFRAWGLAIGGLVILVVLGSLPVALAWAPLDLRSGATLGVIGGIVGSVVGIAGGVFGTIAGVRRARITALLRELESGRHEPG